MDVDEAANPFSDWVFREPRQPRASVAGLNDHALGRLLGQFRRLHPEAGASKGEEPAVAGMRPERRAAAEPAQLVVSPQPGFGKSHLIGRLFAALEGRATLIYVAPFQSPSLCWQSVLLRTMQELSFPDRSPDAADAAPLTAAGELPTQLDAFVHGVIAHLVAGLIETGRVEHADATAASAWLRGRPLELFPLANPDNPWSDWLRTVFEPLQGELERELGRAGLAMQSPGWLRVLFRYATAGPDDETRALALAWLSGQALEPDEAGRLGLRTGEIALAELPDQINELCWRRLMDFCQLAAFYRPFVFCFDQTEAYGHAPALARCFGALVAQIHLLAPNQMMVVTANQQPWEDTVAPHMETADRDRFRPLPLDGLNRLQAEELVRLRCAQEGAPVEQIAAFLTGGGWLQSKFPTERNRMGARQFLQLCSARWQQQETWWNAQDRAVAKKAAETSPTLAQLLDRYAADMARKKRRLLFNPDIFRWLIEDVARARPGWSVAVNLHGKRSDLLPIVWTPTIAPGGSSASGLAKIFIGFEPGDNWKRWRSILQEAGGACQPGGPTSSCPPTAKAVFFRTAEQTHIPGARWTIGPEIQSARRVFLDLVELDESSTAELYAARGLYLDAVAGDLAFPAEDVLDFLVAELEPFWERIAAPLDPVVKEVRTSA